MCVCDGVQGNDVEILKGPAPFLKVVCVTAEAYVFGYEAGHHTEHELVDYMLSQGPFFGNGASMGAIICSSTTPSRPGCRWLTVTPRVSSAHCDHHERGLNSSGG